MFYESSVIVVVWIRNFLAYYTIRQGGEAPAFSASSLEVQSLSVALLQIIRYLSVYLAS